MPSSAQLQAEKGRPALPYPHLREHTYPLFQPFLKVVRRPPSKLAGSTPFDEGFYKGFMENRHNASLLFLGSEPAEIN